MITPDSSSSWYEIYEINEIYSFASRYTRSKTFFPPSFFPDTIRASNSMCPRMNRSWMAGTSAFFSILVAGSTSREIGYQPARHPNGLSSPLDGEETATQFPSALFIRPRKPWNAKFPAERAAEPRVSLSAITPFREPLRYEADVE